MDKIRPIFAGIYRNRFWVTCFLVTVASLVTWFLAQSAVEKQRAEFAQKLDSKNSSIETVLKTSAETGDPRNPVDAHPNADTQTQMDAKIDKAANAALAAWNFRYSKQANVLKPAEKLPDHIKNEMLRHNPPEKPLKDGKEIFADTYRDTFKMEIIKEMPRIASIINTTWKYEEELEKANQAADDENKSKRGRGGALPGRGGSTTGPGGPGGGPGNRVQAKVEEDLVVWDEENQDFWLSKLTEFVGFDGNIARINDRPTSQQMLALQQDLWILEATFKIVEEVNRGAKANDLAPIERIDHVFCGREAVTTKGTLQPINMEIQTVKGVTKAKGGQRSGLSKGTGGRSRAGASKLREQYKKVSDSLRKGSKPFDEKESFSPFHGRYVDRDFSQLSEKDVNNVLTTKELSDQSYLAVAKRVPVRVAVIMDEREIGNFLAAAANSEFSFEVRTMRINRHTANEGAKRSKEATGGAGGQASLGRAGGAGGGGVMADDDATVDSGSGSAGSADNVNVGRAERRQSFDVKVEFLGIMKIYNPVNPKLFFPNDNDDKNTSADVASR